MVQAPGYFDKITFGRYNSYQTLGRMEGRRMQTGKQGKEGGESYTKYALAAFLGMAVFVIVYKYALNQVGSQELNDIQEHARYAQDIYLDRMWNAWRKIPYLLWHLCVKGSIKFLVMPPMEAVAFVCGGFALLNYFVMFFLADRTVAGLNGRDGGIPAAGAAGMLSLVQPMYMYWFNPYQYEGQFSINPIFNPTHTAVKPFGLLCFMLAADLIRRYRGKEKLYFTGIGSDRVLYVLFSVCLLFSAFAKPTFMYMLLPAGALYLLGDLAGALWRGSGREGPWTEIKKHLQGKAFLSGRKAGMGPGQESIRAESGGKHKAGQPEGKAQHRGEVREVWGFMWRIGCASIPAMLYLLLEYAAFYFLGGTDPDSHVAVYPFLTAWHSVSPNIPKSLVLSMAFPFWMCLTNWKYFWNSVEGKLCLLGYAVGTLEFCFFVETGSRLWHLNFAWCMMSGMLLIWVMAAARLVHITIAPGPGRWGRAEVAAGWMLLSLHFFSGLYYISPYQYLI